MGRESGMYFGIRKEELPFSLLMGVYFFLVITSFWVLKPIKKALFIDYYKNVGGFDFFGWHMLGSQAELLAKVMNMLVAAGAVAVFTLCSRRMRRQQLTFLFSLAFIVAFLIYLLLLQHPHGFTVWSFYLFGDLFSTMMVPTFYAFLNDSVTADSAKRTYGLVGFGGVAGGAVGALSVSALIKQVSNPAWMIILAGTAVVIIAIAAAAGRMAPQKNAPTPATQEEPASTGSPALEGAKLVF
ncbi:MAG TPA: hypothetical protein VLR94_00465, partial [Acidobacteriota bacterium]|nr:hypothetical protein [Acidobacteriota bacterium]